jgi:hypothetical protein
MCEADMEIQAVGTKHRLKISVEEASVGFRVRQGEI